MNGAGSYALEVRGRVSVRPGVKTPQREKPREFSEAARKALGRATHLYMPQVEAAIVCAAAQLPAV